MSRWLVTLLLVLVVAGLLAGCAGGRPLQQRRVEPEKPAGFWRGLWHGMIAPITFIISLFSDKVNLYEVFNNGNWYNFGFMLGLSISMGGSGAGASHGRRRRD